MERTAPFKVNSHCILELNKAAFPDRPFTRIVTLGHSSDLIIGSRGNRQMRKHYTHLSFREPIHMPSGLPVVSSKILHCYTLYLHIMLTTSCNTNRLLSHCLQYATGIYTAYVTKGQVSFWASWGRYTFLFPLYGIAQSASLLCNEHGCRMPLYVYTMLDISGTWGNPPK